MFENNASSSQPVKTKSNSGLGTSAGGVLEDEPTNLWDAWENPAHQRTRVKYFGRAEVTLP